MAASLPVVPHDPYLALRVRNYRDYMIGSFLSLLGRQAVSVAITWEIYQWTGSATALGLVGFLNLIPLLLLSLPAGAIADHSDRRKVISFSHLILVFLSLSLAALSIWREHVPNLAPLRWTNAFLRDIALLFERHVDPSTLRFDQPAFPLILLVLTAMACTRIIGWPSRSSIVPLLLPPHALSNAITWGSSAFEIATVFGPMLGGFMIAWFGFPAVYVFDAVLGAIFCWAVIRTRYFNAPPPASRERSWRHLLAGADFIWKRKVILGASSLDLFATLLGGAITLLPLYADRILHVGPIGLGWLRAAPSIGAFAMAMWLAHRAPLARPGRALLWSVAGFGVAIIIFGLSHWFWLSFIALVFTGVFDNVSVVVRQSLVQLLTPNHLRGRVTGVNQIFIGSSNEVGSLRAGLTAAVFGPIAAVVSGGIGTLLVVALIARSVPALARLAPLPTLKPEEDEDFPPSASSERTKTS